MPLTARRYSLDDPFVTEVAAASASVFSAVDFLTALSSTLARAQGAELVLIGVSDADGAPVALFPFTSRRIDRLRHIEGLGLGVADYYAPVLLRDADQAELWQAVRAALPAADILRLVKVPDGSLYGQTHGLEHAGFLAPMGLAATTLPLLEDGRPIDPTTFGAAKDVRRKQKKLAALGPVDFALAITAAEKTELFEALLRFRNERFVKLGRRDKLNERGVPAFYRQLLEQGTAEIYGLRVAGEIVAVVYGFAHTGVFTVIIPTMTTDPKFEPGSPGLVSLYLSIEDRIARGDRVFDLSVGALHYKTRFGAQKHELLELVEARSLAGLPTMLMIKARTFMRLRRLAKQAAAA
jgi:CelD/BcsL family acetyltransferase involved in cellulose biosynthesis